MFQNIFFRILVYFSNWIFFFFYSDSESKLKLSTHHSSYTQNQTVIPISLEETVPYSEEKMVVEQLLAATNTTQFAHLQN